MTRQFFTILGLLVWLGSSCQSYTYSTLVSDKNIEMILNCEVKEMDISPAKESQLPVKVDQDIVDWTKIYNLDINALNKIEDVVGYETEDTLKGMPEIFSESDFKYMIVQIEQQIGKQWRLPISDIKFVNNQSKDCSHFSIPLFNEQHNCAIIYEEEVYSKISSCGIIKIYMKDGEAWKLYKSMLIWLI